MIAPVKSTRITNQHGTPGWGKFGKHCGIDYGVPVGTPVYAPGAGTIRAAYFGTSGGNMLEIEIGAHWHRFLHLDRYVRKTGAVKEGELIGYSGATGNVTGPHLHWDVRKAGTTWDADYNNYLDPLSLITSKGEAMPTQAEAKKYWKTWTGQDMTESQAIYYSTKPWLILAEDTLVTSNRIKSEKIAFLEARINEVSVALINEQSKPPLEVIKEVEKIVEVPAPIDPDAVVITKNGLWDIFKGLFKKG